MLAAAPVHRATVKSNLIFPLCILGNRCPARYILPNFVRDCAYDVNLRWLGSDTLLITYKDAKSADVDRVARLLGRSVRVFAKAGVNDASAPCGGMEYSQGRSDQNGS